MPLIRSKSKLVLTSVLADNLELPWVPTLENTAVYGFRYYNRTKSTCMLKGLYGKGYSGKHTVRFNKLSVITLTKNCDLTLIKRPGVTSTLGYLDEINKRFGFDLSPTEVVDYPILASGTVCRLSIQPESVIFCDSIDLQLIDALPKLSDLISTYDLEPELNIYQQGLVPSAVALTRGHDYSELGNSLVALQSGVLADDAAITLATQLKTVDTVPWGLVADTQYSLIGSTVLYNGLVVAIPNDVPGKDLVSPKFVYVLIVQPIGDTGLTASPLIVHYNVYSGMRS